MDKNIENIPYFDLSLSFAGEDRKKVEGIAKILVDYGVLVFYDDFYRDLLWGKELVSILRYIYGYKSKYCVIFISTNYNKKLFASKVELESILAKSIRAENDYILPVILEDTWVIGIPDTTCYIDARNISENDIATLIIKKIGFLSINGQDEKVLFDKLSYNTEIVGSIFQFRNEDKILYWRYNSYNVTMSRLRELGSLLSVYDLADYQYIHDGVECWISIQLSKKGERFYAYLVKELSKKVKFI